MSVPALILDSTRRAALDAGFAAAFGGTPERYFSAPGRTEIGGNHTDHQRGRVLAAAVNLDTVAAVRANGTKTIGFELYEYWTFTSQQQASAMAFGILIIVVAINFLLNKLTKGEFSI